MMNRVYEPTTQEERNSQNAATFGWRPQQMLRRALPLALAGTILLGGLGVHQSWAQPMATPVAIPVEATATVPTQVTTPASGTELAATPSAQIPHDNQPTIKCMEDGTRCAIDAGRDDAVNGTISITGARGWQFVANGTALTRTTDVDLRELLPNGQLSGTVVLTYTSDDVCTSSDAMMTVTYTFADGTSSMAQATLHKEAQAGVQTAPSATIDPLDFGVFQWTGSNWNTASATTRIKIAREPGCDVSTAYAIVIGTHSNNPELNPELTCAVVTGGDIVQIQSTSSLGGETTVGYVPAGFEGNAELQIQYFLAPGDEVQIGEYEIVIDVTLVPVNPADVPQEVRNTCDT